MSEYAVEIERMMVKLENLFMDSGNLSMNYFVRIENALNKMEQIDRQELKVVNEWWSNLQEDFKRLNRNYQDYLREFYSGKSDKVLKSIEFVVHKDRFISYLQEFVQQLQNKSIRIENIIKNLPQQMVDGVLERVIDSELAIPHPDSEIQDLRVNAIRENIYGKWQSLSDWFVPTDKHPSESQKVMDITDDVIRKIIQNAALIVQIQNWGISRKEDYKKFIQMFVQCKNVEEAHKLSAHIFGIQHVRYFKVNCSHSTDSINSSVFDELPSEYELKPHTRTYKPRIHKSGFESKALEKLAQRNQYLKKLEEDRELVMKYIQGNQLDISRIDDCISVDTRETLLRWIAQANLTVSKSGRTEYGQAFHLIKQEAKDGDFFISDWLRNRNTLEFLGIWERIYNPTFNYGEFAIIKSQAGLNRFKISVKEWVAKTNAIGLKANAGRYGGTFAYKDIAFEFGMWISPEFKIYLIQEFERLKELELKQYGWDIKRNLTKINYGIHTDAIKQNLIPKELSKEMISRIYASEADILNVALFGTTAKEWELANPKSKGNIRDYASGAQLVCLTNLESLNSVMIKEGKTQKERIEKLNEIAIYQMTILTEDKRIEDMNLLIQDEDKS